jgi:CRP-like cAMP-binding protein
MSLKKISSNVLTIHHSAHLMQRHHSEWPHRPIETLVENSPKFGFGEPVLRPVESMTSEAILRRFQKGEQLNLEQELFWQIEQGWVKTTTWDEFGDVVCLGIWGEGDIVGAPLTQLQPYQLECLSEVKARSLTVSGNYLQQLISSHSRQTEALLSIVHCRRMSDRLLKALDWLVQKFGKRTTEGWLLDFWLTHQTLAEMIGTTRVTITRLLSELEQQGRITRQSRHRILLITNS